MKGPRLMPLPGDLGTYVAAVALVLYGASCGQGSGSGGGGGGGGSSVDAGSGGGGDASGGSEDTTAPDFAGAESAASSSPTSIRVGWEAATDDTTPQDAIEYLIYVAEASGGQGFGESDLISEAGAARATIEGLEADAEYFFVVRARDQAGNVDDNTREVSADTSAPDTTPPDFEGVESAEPASATSVDLAWTNASDDTAPDADIVYNVYVATSSGAQDFSSPALTTTGGATSATLTALSPGETYHAVVRAEDLAGNEDENEVEASAPTADVSFSTDVQPIFSQNCTNNACHDDTMPKEGLNLTEGAAYENLVDQPSEQCPELLRVAPGDAGASYLMRKLSDDRSGCFSGKQMPSSTDALPESDLEVVRAWIDAGAAND